MGKCQVCANEYDKTFEITLQNKSYTFDSFECAIHALAPQCDHCGCKIIGHGLEENQHYYCCAHCSRKHGVNTLHDRA